MKDVAQLARQWLEGNRPLDHLLWREREWPKVRERILKHPVFPSAWPKFREAIDKAIADWNPPPHDDKGLTQAALTRPQPEVLAMAYLLTDDKRYLQTLERVMAYDLSTPAWHYANYDDAHPGNSIDLSTGRLSREWGLACCWVGSELSPDSVNQVRQRLCTQVFDPFLERWPKAGECWLHFFTHNWPSVITAEIGIAALSLAEQYPRAPEVVELCLRTILRTYADKGEDGDWDEGPGYLAYGVSSACVLGRALWLASDGAIDLLDHPFLRKIGDFGMHVTRPEGGMFNFSDCGTGEGGFSANVMCLLASHYRNPAYQWNAQTFGPPTGAEALAVMDAGLKPEPPTISTARHFYPTGVVTARSDWSDKAIYVALRNRGTASRPSIMNAHQHSDLNSFVLSAHGEPLVIDPPAPDYTFHHAATSCPVPWWDSTGHSTLLFDGQGQQRTNELDYGQVRLYEATDDWVHVVGCADGAYRHLNASHFRHLVLIANAYVLIVDYIGVDRRRHVTWNLPHLGKSEISERTARVVRPHAVLDVRCLADDRPVYPARTTFPRLSRWNVGKATTEWNVNDTIEVLSFNTCVEAGNVHLWPFLLFPLRPGEAAPVIVEHAVTDDGFHAVVRRNGIAENLFVGKHNFMFRYSRQS